MAALKTPADFGALITHRRRALGLDQASLAKKAGVSRLWINQVERGKPGASLGLILRALAVLGVELTADASVVPGDVPSDLTPDIDAIIDRARRKDRS
jgi:HTH-type transcriptional regulator/antitoxin HipB